MEDKEYVLSCKKYNKRHKIVIFFIVLFCIAIQYLPYKAINHTVEADHQECIELSRMPECASEKQFYAYEVNENHTRIMKNSKYNTCYDYYSNKRYVSGLNSFLEVCSLFIILADFAGIIYLIIWGLVESISKVYGWLTEKDEEDEDEEEN